MKRLHREGWMIASVMAATVVAFALRIVELTGRSIWLDEGTTLLRLSGTLVENVTNVVTIAGKRTIDTQPPVYFLLLQGFIALAGEHEFLFRFFSVAFGVLCVPLVAVVGRSMFNPATAVVAALFVALSPGLIWYSREIRMYSLVTFLAALMIYAAQGCCRAHRRIVRGWLFWLATAVVALLTHYTFVGLIVGQAIFLIAVTARRWRTFTPRDQRLLIVAAGGSAAAGVLILLTPAVQSTVSRLLAGQELNYAFVPLPIIAQTQFGGLLLGLNAFDFSAGLIGLIVAALCALAAIAPTGVNEPADAARSRTLLAASCFAPLVLWFALSLFKPNYQGFRHLILISPAAIVLLARLCAWPAVGGPLQRPAAWSRGLGALLAAAVAATIIAVQLYGVAYTFIRTPNWQDDWRALAYYVRDHWQPGDLLVIGGLPTVALPITPYLRGVEWVVENGANAPAGLPPATRRVWYVDRGRGRPRWLDDRAFLRRAFLRQTIDFPARSTAVQLRLLELEPPTVTAPPADAQTVAAQGDVGAPAWIGAYRLLPGAALNLQPNMLLELYWRRAAPGDMRPGDVNVSVRLLHDNQVWLDVRVPADLLAADGVAWGPDEYFRTTLLIPIQLGLPALPYQLEITALAGDKQEPLQRITQPVGSASLACCIRRTTWPGRVQPMTIAAAARPQPALDYQPLVVDFPPRPAFDDVVVAVAEFPSVVRPGVAMPVVLTWQPTRDRLPAWQTELVLQGLSGNLASVRREAGTSAFPPSAWKQGEPVRDQYVLRLPDSAAPGVYVLWLNRHRESSVERALLGFVRLEDYPRTPVATAVQHPVNAQVGEITLLGYTLPGPLERGKTYDVLTHWRVDAQPRRDGKLFLHVLTADGRLIAQDDSGPFQGARSTLTFRPGDGIDQVHRIALPVDLPAGEYVLWAGIYNSDDLQRWPASQDGRPAPNDIVKLGTFTLP